MENESKWNNAEFLDEIRRLWKATETGACEDTNAASYEVEHYFSSTIFMIQLRLEKIIYLTRTLSAPESKELIQIQKQEVDKELKLSSAICRLLFRKAHGSF